jgi:hypothetical protein
MLVVAEGRWLLKGGLALDFRLRNKMRTTRDVDLSYVADQESATQDLLNAQAVDLEDFFVLHIERHSITNEQEEGGTIRFHVTAELASRTFDEVIIDINFGEWSESDVQLIEGRDILSFAGFERLQVPTLSLERHVAEKVHAYTRTYSGGRRSSRVKDLVDLYLIFESFSLEPERLREALESTFVSRATHDLPAKLPPPPDSWEQGFRTYAQELEIPADVYEAYLSVRSHLAPVLESTSQPK